MVYSHRILPWKSERTDKTKFQNNTVVNSRSPWALNKKKSPFDIPVACCEIWLNGLVHGFFALVFSGSCWFDSRHFFPKELASSTEEAEGSITSSQFHLRLHQNPFFTPRSNTLLWQYKKMPISYNNWRGKTGILWFSIHMLTLSKCQPLSFKFPISMKCWTFIHGSIIENVILIWWYYNSVLIRLEWAHESSCNLMKLLILIWQLWGAVVLNACVSPKLIHWKLIPKVTVLGVGILGGSGLK